VTLVAGGMAPPRSLNVSPRRERRESGLEFADVRWYFLREAGSAAGRRIGKPYAVKEDLFLWRQISASSAIRQLIGIKYTQART
jgi:hypothetical protein